MEEKIESNVKPKIINYIGFNFDSSFFSIGTDIGFNIYQTIPLNLIITRQLNGGIGLVKILEKTNIICLTGGGKNPRFIPNKLIIWDDNKNEISEEFRCNSFILNCYPKQNCIFVICSDNIILINTKTMKIVKNINTINNPRGISSISNDPNKYILTFPDYYKGNIILFNFEDLEKSKEEEIINIRKLDNKESIIKNAHKGNINNLSLNYNGTKLASASDRGTLIRIFNTQTKSQINEFRRGSTEANIYSLNFSFDDSFLGLTSDHDSCHIFLLNNQIKGKNENKNGGVFSYLTSNFSFGDVGKKLGNVLGQEYSWKKIEIPHKVRSVISFVKDNNNNIYIIDKNGNYLSINLIEEQEPKITKKERII